MRQSEIAEVLRLHGMWLRCEDGGRRANLIGADLIRANLIRANLSRADLSRADLSRANLSGANLSGADLSKADLSGSDLSGADLSRADLSGADLSRADLSGAVHAWAQVAFMGHGECGRMLTAVVYKEGDNPVYQCGCFSGLLDDLKSYIANGAERYRASRTYAMEVVTEMLAMPKP
jgi:uncharacterized protein YjbI with pentapeptide repeats